jgi:hypothetical protein
MKYRGEGLHPVISTIFSGFDGAALPRPEATLPEAA